MFNTDAVKSVTLYKGGFPARFGGRLSSVVDIRMNDGNIEKLHGNVSLGLISSKFNLEGPLFSKNTSFNFAARRSYFDILSKLVIPFVKFEDSFSVDAAYYFYDMNVKITHKINEKNKLFFSLYNGRDDIKSEVNDSWTYNNNTVTETDMINIGWNWGNVVANARWNSVLNNKLFANTSATFTQYNFKTLMGNEFTTAIVNPEQVLQKKFLLDYRSGIADYCLKTDFDYAPAPEHDVKYGAAYTFHVFRPGISVDKLNTENNVPTSQTDTIFDNYNTVANEFSLYAEDNWSICSFLKAKMGLHYAAFDVQNTTYQSLQPRISLRTLVSDNMSFKAGFATMQQFVHLLAYNNFSLPNDLWVPATANVKPMQSLQYSAGAFYNFKNSIDFSVEAYYKKMDNLIEYTDGASFFESSTGWEDKIVTGRGQAYGVEFLIQKSVGKTTGWIAYTWSKTERIFDKVGQQLNGGEAFPAKYDRRHDINIVASHRFSKRFDLSGTVKYCSGNYVTLPLQNFKGFSEFDSRLPYFSRRNNYQLPDYFRIDIGANFYKKLKHGDGIWNVSIYNVTNSMNPFYVFVKTHKYNDPLTGKIISEKTFNKITVFPFIPSVSYSFKF